MFALIMSITADTIGGFVGVDPEKKTKGAKWMKVVFA